eukprot:TRINITY_DN14162_c0_g1_i1.p1 TRINITY_DN14162_c0_g1~~TRINITY_DN14162_c0_g1_i1.p1  ORF type:complete len:298 (+),score=74.88 TRINITY_DN14162_c0_g1_i1:100-894(+)
MDENMGSISEGSGIFFNYLHGNNNNNGNNNEGNEGGEGIYNELSEFFDPSLLQRESSTKSGNSDGRENSPQLLSTQTTNVMDENMGSISEGSGIFFNYLHGNNNNNGNNNEGNEGGEGIYNELSEFFDPSLLQRELNEEGKFISNFLAFRLLKLAKRSRVESIRKMSISFLVDMSLENKNFFSIISEKCNHYFLEQVFIRASDNHKKKIIEVLKNMIKSGVPSPILHHYINHDQIIYNQKIGFGASSNVFEGEYNSQKVAIKKI